MNEQGIYYFHQGTNYYAYELLGSHYTKEATTFRVWAPNAKIVSVVGDFNNWDTRTHSMKKITNEGLWEIVIPNINEFDKYQYAILTRKNKLLFKSDPYAFHSELRPGKCSKVYNLNNFTFTDQDWMKNRHVKQSHHAPINIYEMHLGSWRRYKDGSVFDYQKIALELVDYCKKMGYTHVELMPVSEYPYDPSWGYQVTGYFAITSRYGTPNDFKKFVDICHNNNIGVIVDWVPGHFTKDAHGLIEFDGKCLYENPDPTRKEHLGWGTRIFDYGRNEIQSFLVSSVMYLLKEYHIDGIRVDAVSSMLYLDYCREEGEWHPNSLGTNINLEAVAFLQKTNAVVHQTYPEVLMIAEESTSFPKITAPTEYGGLGFNYKWNMGWMNDTLEYMKKDPIYRQYHHDKITFQLSYIFSENYILALSHDEVVHMKGSLINKMPGSYEQKFANLRTYMLYQITHPGKKLLFMGGEFGQFSEWNELKELDWNVLEFEKHQQLQKFNSDLNYLYKNEKSLYENDYDWNGFNWLVVDDKGHNVFAYERMSKEDKLVVIINFSFAYWEKYEMPLENGEYEVILSSDETYYGGYSSLKHKKYKIKNNRLTIDLPAIAGIILRKVK